MGSIYDLVPHARRIRNSIQRFQCSARCDLGSFCFRLQVTERPRVVVIAERSLYMGFRMKDGSRIAERERQPIANAGQHIKSQEKAQQIRRHFIYLHASGHHTIWLSMLSTHGIAGWFSLNAELQSALTSH